MEPVRADWAIMGLGLVRKIRAKRSRLRSRSCSVALRRSNSCACSCKARLVLRRLWCTVRAHTSTVAEWVIHTRRLTEKSGLCVSRPEASAQVSTPSEPTLATVVTISAVRPRKMPAPTTEPMKRNPTAVRTEP